MFHSDARGAYTALELEDAADQQRAFCPSPVPPASEASAPVRWLIIACLVSGAVSALSLGLTTFWAAPYPALKPASAPRFPSAYIGLERVDVSPRILALPPVPNYPLLLSSVDRSKPKDADTNGTVFHVDRDHTTVMQFRVHDYGLERCTLNITVPAPSELGPKTYHASRTTQPLDVWTLAAAALRPRTLSWAARPARLARLGTLDFAAGTSSDIPWFSCPSDSLQTFEFACPRGDAECSVRFRQDRAAPLLGVQMYQRHS